jgi:uncharacterized small protein (TIGR04563 family)
MPEYLRRFDIDWGWPRLSEAERAVVRRHEARAHAEPGTHTLVTLKEALAAASRELPGREIRSRAMDEYGEYALVAREGRCSDAEPGAFDEGGEFSGPLSADDYRAAGVKTLYVSLFWPESMLRVLQEQAHRLDRSLSWVVQKALAVSGAGTSAPTEDGALPRVGARCKQSVYLPIEIWAELHERADREDRSMSSLVQQALAGAWPAITKLPAEPK